VRPESPHPLDDAFVPGDLTAPDLGSREAIRSASLLAWYPAETDVSIRPGWFYHVKQDAQVKTPDALVDIYFSSVGRNGVLLLNVPPDQRGRIADADVLSLQGMRAILDRAFAAPVARAAIPAQAVPGRAAAVYEAAIGAGRTFDVALLQEDISQGQRVEQFTLELCAGGTCKEVARGTTIGYKRLLRFPEVRVDAAQHDARVRLAIARARGTPVVSAAAFYRMGSVEPPAAAPGVTR
jgi:alpha-L-fucosidase